jgi:deazaflavin-dependent oxidoreductase (nitroreductase family)
MTETPDMNEMNKQIITEFRENSGKVGGMFEGAPMILVHHVGAKSGTERVTPLVYLADGSRLFVFASKGGAPDNPAWYHNLLANPKTTVEVGTDTFEVVAKNITGTERDEIYARQVAVAPGFGEYQRNTTRIIPVVELERVNA